MRTMKLRYYPVLLFLLSTVILSAQNDTTRIEYSFNTRFNIGDGRIAPFLSTANQYDRYNTSPNSLTVWGTARKELKMTRAFDYGFGMELDGNVAKTENRFFPGEYYIQGKAFFLNMVAGSKREVFGNQDAELSSGGMLWSQNSRPMPKISIETNGYIDVPYTKGYMAVKGGLSHGWFDENIGIKNLLLHHKYAYIKLGGSFPVTVNYGVQHVAQWGGESTKYGTMPETFSNYLRIFAGKSGGPGASQSDQINVLGNHIISQNLGLDINLKSVIVSLYWQNLTEDPPVRFITSTMNVQDGLWGMSVRLAAFRLFHSFVLEYMSTTDHSGPWHDLDGVIFGGGDEYYKNGQIPQGWSYKGMTIGNPWITSPKYNQDGTLDTKNNSVRLYYFSGKGEYKALNYKTTLAYSENFGIGIPSWSTCKRQLSYQLETSTKLNFIKNTTASIAISGDNGAMYGNNLALILGLSWSGIFK